MATTATRRIWLTTWAALAAALLAISLVSWANRSDASPAKSSKKACTTWVKVDAVANGGPEGGENGPPSKAAGKKFATSIKKQLDRFAKSAPSKVKSAARKLQPIVDHAAKTGDVSKLDPTSNETLGTNLNKVEKWVHRSCGFEKLDVMGVDYKFQDLPKKVKAGTASISFMNMSKDEPHEMAVLRIKPHSGVTAKQLIATVKSKGYGAEQTIGSKVEDVGYASAAPGQTGYNTVKLVPGDYVAACFVPVKNNEKNGPHAQAGMIQAFTVS